jgi:phosphoglycerol transferase MdoB-like AlkP superfamily enzyme
VRAKSLTPKEEQRLWKLSLILFSPVLILFLVWLVPILRRPSITLWDYWTNWLLPFVLFGPLVLLFFFEVLYYLKEKKNGKFHVIRMAKQAGFVLVAVVVATTTAFISSNYIAPLAGLRNATLIWFFLTIFLFGVIAYETRNSLSPVLAIDH